LLITQDGERIKFDRRNAIIPWSNNAVRAQKHFKLKGWQKKEQGEHGATHYFKNI